MVERKAFAIGGKRVPAGTRRTVDIPVSVMSDHTPVSMSVHVIHGRKDGPVLFVSAAVHGDEIIGVEIARRLLKSPNLDGMRGTLMVIPIVNAFGFLNQSRYLPDRRDLNRSFPGSSHGSLASRLADIFMTEIVKRSDLGIDLHSAAIHRTNLPQIRVSPSKPETLALAEDFGAPVIITAKLRDGSMRQFAQEAGVDVLLFEGGEALRLDEMVVRSGVTGILRVMKTLKMVPAKGITKPRLPSLRAASTNWIRSPAGGLLRLFKSAGEAVQANDLLGIVSDPFGEVESEVIAPSDGLIIGRTNLPVVNEGDGLFHIAEIRKTEDPGATVDKLSSQLLADPMFDEDEII
ncbi:succinylglutamate desuccinylase/aspartoacylase family protein [Roseibium sediminis]|uniref:succinylglutamate desuccinylase/aspartoacylase family protein n=1 Tax=Roseibium sediminis TaxID=1775174 RepID=UPI00123D389A|nr:succinylglutamate desuccinylase/aspartoacylase family protein [Roseibium sediminis]